MDPGVIMTVLLIWLFLHRLEWCGVTMRETLFIATTQTTYLENIIMNYNHYKNIKMLQI